MLLQEKKGIKFKLIEFKSMKISYLECPDKRTHDLLIYTYLVIKFQIVNKFNKVLIFN